MTSLLRSLALFPRPSLTSRSLRCVQHRPAISHSYKRLFSTGNERFEAEIVDSLRKVIDPDTKKDIISMGLVKGVKVEGGNVVVSLELSKNYRHLKLGATQQLSAIPWIKGTTVSMAPQEKKASEGAGRAGGLSRVSSVLAVFSCKGGVGKSTVAVNLAYTLSKLGARVGIFDADIYGPSLPTLISPKSTILRQDPVTQLISPIEYEGVKTMSYGFAAKNKKAVMRGPMVSNIVNQLLTFTDWGALDYLVLDMPPGTGDIQLTLCQQLSITGAVMVTTPQKLSFVDVVKGIEMFDDVRVPTIAVVENMATFECGHCHTLHRPFGNGYRRQLVDQFGIKNSFTLPIDPDISAYSDSGRPYILQAGIDSPVGQIYRDMAGAVAAELTHIKTGTAPPAVSFQPGEGIIVQNRDEPSQRFVVSPADLRRRCACALCVEELTGRRLLRPEDVKEDVFPTTIEPKGNYAVAITWSDGHTSSIYPYERLRPEWKE